MLVDLEEEEVYVAVKVGAVFWNMECDSVLFFWGLRLPVVHMS